MKRIMIAVLCKRYGVSEIEAAAIADAHILSYGRRQFLSAVDYEAFLDSIDS